LQADTQTTVTMLCLAGLHALDKKYKQNKNVTKFKKNVKNVLRLCV